MLSRLKKIFTGPDWEEMGLPADYGKNTAAVSYDSPIPYKPGTEKALWPVVTKKPGLIKTWIRATIDTFTSAWGQ